MDRQKFWNDFSSMDTQNLPDPPVFPSDLNMSCSDLVDEGTSALSMWSSGGPSSSRHPPSMCEESKLELGWPPSLRIGGGQGSATETSRLDAANMSSESRMRHSGLEANGKLAMEDVNLNLDINEPDNSHPFSQYLGVDDFNGNSNRSSQHDGKSSKAFESATLLHPNNRGSSGGLNLHGSSSNGIGVLTEDFENQSVRLLDDQRMALKRKSIEAVPAQGSASGISSPLYQNNSLLHPVSTPLDANTSLNISSYSRINAPENSLNPRIRNVRLGAPTANAESSHRNCRSRIIPPGPLEHGAAPPSHWLPRNSLLPSGASEGLPLIPPGYGAFANTQPSDSRLIAGTSEGIPLIPPGFGTFTNMQPLPLNGGPLSRTSRSLRSTLLPVQRAGSATVPPAEHRPGSSRATATMVQVSIGVGEDNTPRNNFHENIVFVPPTDIRNSGQDTASWGLGNGQMSIGHTTRVPQSVAPSRVDQLTRPTLIPHQSARNYQHSLETIRQSSGHTRDHQRQYIRSALEINRHIDGVLVGGSSRSMAAAREGRNRALSEHIRNAMQQFAQRGDNLQLQDILLHDHPAFYGRAADLHDRHRDLRLDVDNMSYEELLALEERIGNVSTGLGEETILKYLKQRKYISLSEEAPEEVEPCCVCQEAYLEGDDVGRLDCRHDFHTGCIKQWLLQKNLCPICKTTGLDIEKRQKEGL